MEASRSAIGKRKSHKKSRQGCRNCKIRKVKCDETKPRCRGCRSYGVLCSYDGTVTDLQIKQGEYFAWSPANQGPESPLHGLVAQSPAVVTDGVSSLELTTDDQARLSRFRDAAAYTIGGGRTVDLFRHRVLSIAFSSPCLMHAMLAITSVHDRYLACLPKRTLAEAYHWSQATTLFNSALSKPIRPQDRDPFWGTAALSGIIAFASIEVTDIEEAWPLKPSDDSDLEWVRMAQGKMAIYNLVDPLRTDSVFSALRQEYASFNAPVPLADFAHLDARLVRACGMTEHSTSLDNPYFTAVHALKYLETIPEDTFNGPRALMFMHHMSKECKTLLHQKDPVALLLMALWYQMASNSVWWIEQRAMIECQAICVHLRRFHYDKPDIIDLLPQHPSQLWPSETIRPLKINSPSRWCAVPFA